MCHPAAANRLNERFLDNAVFDVQRQLACALLWSAPAHAVGQARDVGYFFNLGPTAFLWDRRRAVIRPFGNYTHLFNFMRMHTELCSFVGLKASVSFGSCSHYSAVTFDADVTADAVVFILAFYVVAARD